ncbi:MAG TPA: hypothetical protein VEB20_04720 [Azospirillaceae bacterium]|nr:hypothetical protein [Azospirillaceae bacterium]
MKGAHLGMGAALVACIILAGCRTTDPRSNSDQSPYVSIVAKGAAKYGPVLASYVTREDHSREVEAIAREYAAQLGDWKGCQDMTVRRTYALEGIFGQIMFEEGIPTAGGWKETVAVSGCGVERLLPVGTFADSGRIKSGPMIPGSTIADIRLQRDTITHVYLAALAARPDCDDKIMSDTRFEGFAEGPVPKGAQIKPWAETWTVRACGEDIKVPVMFVPDATGTQIVARAPQDQTASK